MPETFDTHHIVPQFAGGGSGPTINIDPTCHSNLHKQALNLIAKNAKRRAYFPPDQMERAKPFIQQLVIALQEAKEHRSNQQKMKVMIELDKDFLTIMHSLKLDAGFTNLSTFLANILRDYARSKL